MNVASEPGTAFPVRMPANPSRLFCVQWERTFGAVKPRI